VTVIGTTIATAAVLLVTCVITIVSSENTGWRRSRTGLSMAATRNQAMICRRVAVPIAIGR
jgi:hypothetical protein